MHEDFTFGFDWHWRADGAYRGQARCLARSWDKEVQLLHNTLSTDVLDALPLPFVLVASACTREHLQKHLKVNVVSLNIDLGLPTAVLRFDLDYRDNALRRIILYVQHPMAGFHHYGDTKKATALQIDAGTNFFLWLIGAEYDPDTFDRHYTAKLARSANAPLPEMWAYVQKEEEEGRILQLDEYSSGFRLWAERYIEQDLAALLAAGSSIATATSSMVRQRISTSHLEFQSNLREEDARNAAQLSTLQGEAVTVLRVGRVRLDRSKTMTFAITREEAVRILAYGIKPRIRFFPNEIRLCVGDEVVYRKPNTWLLASTRGEEWRAKIIHELDMLRGMTPQDHKPTDISAHSVNDLMAIRSNVRRGQFKNAEIRSRLLRGGIFHCTQVKRKGLVTEQKLCIRSVNIMVPMEASPETVSIQCFLVSEGTEHESKCVPICEVNDPARRLGILMKFKTIEGNHERELWVSLRGERTLKKLNSFVDFLEGKDEAWTTEQPRRFIDRSTAQGTRQPTYTD